MNSGKYIVMMFLILVNLGLGFGQINEDTELFIELREKDRELFNAAFNNCDTATLETLFTEDFEFYHDKGGLTEGRKNFLDPIAENCSKRKAGDPQPAKRILVEKSLKVFPMYKNGILYGAIQHGVHRFEFLNDKNEYQNGDIAKFTHVWIKENDTWKVKRELSYDHQLQKE